MRAFSIGTLGVAVMLACTACLAGPRPAKPPEAAMDMTWKQGLERMGEDPEVLAEVITGTEHFGKGLVTLRVFGDGRLEILNRQAGKEHRYSGQVSREQVRDLAQRLLALDLPNLRSRPGAREPGDTPVRIRVAKSGNDLAAASVWYADRYDLPALDRLIEQTDEIVSKATGGILPY